VAAVYLNRKRLSNGHWVQLGARQVLRESRESRHSHQEPKTCIVAAAACPPTACEINSARDRVAAAVAAAKTLWWSSSSSSGDARIVTIHSAAAIVLLLMIMSPPVVTFDSVGQSGDSDDGYDLRNAQGRVTDDGPGKVFGLKRTHPTVPPVVSLHYGSCGARAEDCRGAALTCNKNSDRPR
jgi:hypothetical protein